MSQSVRIHLDNFDLGRLAAAHWRSANALALPKELRCAGARFFVSPTTYKEALTRAKGENGVRNVAPMLHVLRELDVQPHKEPHKVIAAELHPFVADPATSAEEFEEVHLGQEIRAFLVSEFKGERVWPLDAVALRVGRALRLDDIETGNLQSMLQELYALRLRTLDGPPSPADVQTGICRALTDMRGLFEVDGAKFEAALLRFSKEDDAHRLLGTAAFSQKVTSAVRALQAYPPRGEERFRIIINVMLQCWGYTFRTQLPLSRLAEDLPSLRCHSAYWVTRNPKDDLSFNNLCDAIQLLYVPHVDYFSVDTRVFNDVRRAIPAKYQGRMFRGGEFWPRLARETGARSSLAPLLAAYDIAQASTERRPGPAPVHPSHRTATLAI